MLGDLARIIREVGLEIYRLQQLGKTTGTWVGTQMKAEADQVAHALLCHHLTNFQFQAPIISEEDSNSWQIDRTQPHWLIDPLDGSASFVGGFTGYVTQAVFMVNCVPQLAAIYAPAHNLIYVAEHGRGAFVNGQKLDLSLHDEGLTTLIDNYPQPQGVAYDIYHDLELGKYIESGSIALKICRVADGSADLFIKDIPLQDWDVAPAHLILHEAGGVLTDMQGQPFLYQNGFQRWGVIATNAKANHVKVVNWFSKREGGVS